MTGIFVVLGLVILIVIYVFFEVMASMGAAGYSPLKLISEIFKKKSDKIDNSLTKTSEPAFNRSLMRWRTAAGILMSVMMVYALVSFRPSIGNAFSPFYPWIKYAFWPLLLATIFVFIILWKKERKS